MNHGNQHGTLMQIQQANISRVFQPRRTTHERQAKLNLDIIEQSHSTLHPSAYNTPPNELHYPNNNIKAYRLHSLGNNTFAIGMVGQHEINEIIDNSRRRIEDPDRDAKNSTSFSFKPSSDGGGVMVVTPRLKIGKHAKKQK